MYLPVVPSRPRAPRNYKVEFTYDILRSVTSPTKKSQRKSKKHQKGEQIKSNRSADPCPPSVPEEKAIIEPLINEQYASRENEARDLANFRMCAY